MPKGRKPKFTTDEVIQALKDNHGFVVSAADSLGVSANTVHNYINKYPKIKQAYEDIREKQIDFVESRLLARIREGSDAAIIFFLKTRGRERGYSERGPQDEAAMAAAVQAFLAMARSIERAAANGQGSYE